MLNFKQWDFLPPSWKHDDLIREKKKKEEDNVEEERRGWDKGTNHNCLHEG